MNKGISPVINIIAWAITAVALLLWGILTPVYNDSVEIRRLLVGEKTVNLTIKYDGVTYDYGELTTSSETVYDLLKEYDATTDLKFVGNDEGKSILSIKETQVGDGVYVVRIGDEYKNEHLLAGGACQISDGDKIYVEYKTTGGAVISAPLAEGGVKNARRTPLIVLGCIGAGVSIVSLIRFILKKKKVK